MKRCNTGCAGGELNLEQGGPASEAASSLASSGAAQRCTTKLHLLCERPRINRAVAHTYLPGPHYFTKSSEFCREFGLGCEEGLESLEGPLCGWKSQVGRMCRPAPPSVSSRACHHSCEHHLGWRGLPPASAFTSSFLFREEPFHPAIFPHKASLILFSSSRSFRWCALKGVRNPDGAPQSRDNISWVSLQQGQWPGKLCRLEK